MLRIQQYEQLMKALAAHHAFEGPADKFQELQAEKAASLADKPLGQLITALQKSFLVVEDDSTPKPDQTSGDDDEKPVGWFRIRSTISMNAEAYAQTVQQLNEVRELRNELVHHLIERFNVWTSQGGLDACAYLDVSYERMNRHYDALLAWVTSVDQARASTAAFMSSPQWSQLVAEELQAREVIEWENTPVIALLREAEASESGGGWTPLDAAIAYINKHGRDHFPKRYGCTGWPQLLKQSGLFEIEKLRVADQRGSSRYRSKRASIANYSQL